MIIFGHVLHFSGLSYGRHRVQRVKIGGVQPDFAFQQMVLPVKQGDCRGTAGVEYSARFREYSTSAVPPGTAIVTVKISPLCKAMGKKESQPITMDLSNYPPPFAALLQCMLTALFLTNCCSLSQTAVSL